MRKREQAKAEKKTYTRIYKYNLKNKNKIQSENNIVFMEKERNWPSTSVKKSAKSQHKVHDK